MDAIILVFLCNRCHDTLGFLCMLCSVQHGLLLDFITLLRICRGYNISKPSNKHKLVQRNDRESKEKRKSIMISLEIREIYHFFSIV